jgi:hypothetical protein
VRLAPHFRHFSTLFRIVAAHLQQTGRGRLVVVLHVVGPVPRRWRELASSRHDGHQIKHALPTLAVAGSRQPLPLQLQLAVGNAGNFAVLVLAGRPPVAYERDAGFDGPRRTMIVKPTQTTIIRPRNEKDW